MISRSSLGSVLSYSMVSCFIECRRRFFFRYVEDLLPRQDTKSIYEGKLIHGALSVLTQCGLQQAERHVHNETDATPQPLRDITRVRCLTAIKNYMKSDIFRDVRITQVDVPFNCEVSGKPRITLHGYIDALGEIATGLTPAEPGLGVVVEYKVVRQLQTTMEQQLAIDLQPDFYLYPTLRPAVLYVYLQMPSIEIALATPESDRKYKKDGTLYANQRDKDETPEDYGTRLSDWYANHPDAFRTVMVTRSASRQNSFLPLMRQISSAIKNAVRKNEFYPNPSACRYRSCPYASLCCNDCPEIREINFAKKGEGTATSTTQGGMQDEGQERYDM